MAQASATDIVGAEDRVRVFGLLGAAYGVGFVIGPAIGGLAALGGARLPFFVAGAASPALNAVVACATAPARAGGPRPRSAGPPVPASVASPRAVTGGARGVLARIAAPAVAPCSSSRPSAPSRRRSRCSDTAASVRPGHHGAVFAMVGVVAAAVQGGLVRPLAARFGDVGCLRTGLACRGPRARAAAHGPRPGRSRGSPRARHRGPEPVHPALRPSWPGRVADGERGGALGSPAGALASLARIIGPAARGGCLRAAGRRVPPFVAGGWRRRRGPGVLPGHAGRPGHLARKVLSNRPPIGYR